MASDELINDTPYMDGLIGPITRPNTEVSFIFSFVTFYLISRGNIILLI